MIGLKRIYKVLRHTGAIKIFVSYIILLCAAGVLMNFIEPQVHGIFEGIYFCFVASTTIGFGDIVPVTVLGRVIIIIITLFGILTVAMVPGVIVAYYVEYLKAKENENITEFLEKLDNLPDMSREELTELSKKVKQFREKLKK